MASLMTDFVATSIGHHLVARMRATHERRRISVFAGPPGIGKTTAIDFLSAELGKAFVVVKVARKGAREVLVLQHILDALRELDSAPIFPLFKCDMGAAPVPLQCDLLVVGAEPRCSTARRACTASFAKLTIVFDEAQNLSRQAIEALRYWNDTDRCYAPFPIGLIFVGR